MRRMSLNLLASLVAVGAGGLLAGPVAGQETVKIGLVMPMTGVLGQVGKQAVAINKLAAGSYDHQALRERMGHTRLEIAAGIVVGIVVAATVNVISA